MELLQSDNPFALVILANLYVIQSKGDVAQRMRLKYKLLKHIANSNFPSEIIKNLFNFASFFITLPPEEEEKVVQIMNKQAQAQPQSKKLTYAQQAEAYGDNLLEKLFKSKYEDLIEGFQKEKEAIKEEKATIQEEKATIQEEKATIQEERRKIIVSSYKLLRMTPEEIAKEYSYDLAYIKSVLADLPPETNK